MDFVWLSRWQPQLLALLRIVTGLLFLLRPLLLHDVALAARPALEKILAHSSALPRGPRGPSGAARSRFRL